MGTQKVFAAELGTCSQRTSVSEEQLVSRLTSLITKREILSISKATVLSKRECRIRSTMELLDASSTLPNAPSASSSTKNTTGELSQSESMSVLSTSNTLAPDKDSSIASRSTTRQSKRQKKPAATSM